MKVLIISECSKKALATTRRVVDQFAMRIGRRTWCTEITEDALAVLRKMLKKNASKLTAVSCFWLKKNGENELLWIVGRRDFFSIDGYVSIKNDGDDMIIPNKDEDKWCFNGLIRECVSIAGLFHDFGKSSVMFQNRLRGHLLRNKSNQYITEPYRHEWVSALYFYEILKESRALNDLEFFSFLSSDQNLKDLDIINLENETSKHCEEPGRTPFNDINFEVSFNKTEFKYSMLIMWLILSHHRIPTQLKISDKKNTLDLFEKYNSFEKVIKSLTAEFITSYKDIKAIFCEIPCWKENFTIFNEKGKGKTSLLDSQLWIFKLNKASQGLVEKIQSNVYDFEPYQKNESLFFYIARMSLIIADHECSAENNNNEDLPSSINLYANTDAHKKLKQKLDNHCIQVSKYAKKLVSRITSIRNDLPSLSNGQRIFRKRTINKKFEWQNEAYDIAKHYKDEVRTRGFIGVNLASTGKGKTFANAKIMYGISEGRDFRLSICLGLRSLTKQTGKALIDKLDLEESEIAVITGELSNNEEISEEIESYNDELLDENLYVNYKGEINNILGKYLDRVNTKKISGIINAPILVSTVDTFVVGLESSRGAKHVVPSLRLLSSDVVLDEIDDYGINDLPAILRMIFLAASLGSNVLVSSATIPRILLNFIFQAYASGRLLFNRANKNEHREDQIVCGFFDEFGSKMELVGINESLTTEMGYSKLYNDFYNTRIDKLTKEIENNCSQLAQVIKIQDNLGRESPQSTMAQKVLESIKTLHEKHKIKSENFNRSYSIGIVRFANINPLVNTLKEIKKIIESEKDNSDEFEILYVAYHSRYPQILRSHIENKLDVLLNRKERDERNSEIENALCKTKCKNVAIVVFASPVAEVGRDHDYDWAIIEPSSMRSIIQMSGRVQRHRHKNIIEPNIHVLSKNFNCLKNEKICYCKPGFEDETLQVNVFDCKEHDLFVIAEVEKDINKITSIPRISDLNSYVPTNDMKKWFQFIELKSIALKFKKPNTKARGVNYQCFSCYWSEFMSLLHVVQDTSRFRNNDNNSRLEVFIRKYDDNKDEICFYNINRKGIFLDNDNFRYIDDSEFISCRFRNLFDIDEKDIINEKNCDSNQVSVIKYKNSNILCRYNKYVGIYYLLNQKGCVNG